MALNSSVAVGIGEQVRRARTKARLSQVELAVLASISRRPIYLLESGKGSVRLESLLHILDALGLTLEIQSKASL